MFQTLSQYIASLRSADTAGVKDRKILALMEYYDQYTKITAGQNFAPGVIYARYSSHNQREESIEDQVLDDLKYAFSQKILILGVYYDKALTGRSDDRAGFQQMLRDAQKRKWRYVVTWKIDRFARNRYDSAVYKYKLKQCGVAIRYAKENIPDGPEGIVLESVMEGFAEYYSASLSQNVKRGCHGNAIEAKNNGAHVPMGLKLDENRRYIIDEQTAPVVRLVFDLYHEGRSYSEMVDYLNAKGYRTSFGNKFTKTAIPRILRNEKYIGTYQYADVKIENAFPAIVSRELWEETQEKLGRRSKLNGKKRNSADFILTGQAYCGGCGAPFVGNSGTSKTGKIYYYYKCIDRTRGKLGDGCTMRSVQKDWLENTVIDTTRDLIHKGENFDFLVQTVLDAQARDNDRSRLDSLKTALRETEKNIKNLLAAIESGIITPTTKDRMFQLEEDKAAIQAEIMEETAARPVLSEKDIRFFLSRFRDGDAKDPQYRQSVVDALINSVYIFEDKIVITYNFTNGPTDRLTLRQIEKALEDSALVPPAVSDIGEGSEAVTDGQPA